jgi:hypothetical protein
MLANSTMFGPYEILSPLGAGGMGEVYRARDTRLGRDVAIKVLPANLSHDPDRIYRFEQEARAAGALNHPNVCAIYDVGSHDGAPYVVMELLEGETLRDRISSGSVPLRKALEYASHIAHGLAAAHEKGIVHRDLKPANVFVTKDGRVKVLDFGLAKLTRPEAVGGSGETTATVAVTEEGVRLGTVGYMAPEQVRGERADHRADVFALGAILYELLTGKRAFHGATYVETLSAILNHEPPPLAAALGIGRTLPAGLEPVVRRCLEKSPDERFQSASDLAFQLHTIGASGSEIARVSPQARRGRSRGRRIGIVALVGAVALVVLAAALLGPLRRPSIDPAKLVFTQLTFHRGAIVYSPRFSPDGKTVFYAASWDGRPWEVFETRPGFLNARSLIAGASLHSVSRSGTLAIRPGGTASWRLGSGLALLPITGGTPRLAYEDVLAADWHPDGRTLAVIRFAGGQERLEMPPGRVLYTNAGGRDVPRDVESNGSLMSPRVSPDGSRIAFWEAPVGGQSYARIVVVDSAGRVLAKSGEWNYCGPPSWSTSGREVWFSAGRDISMMDLRALTPGGRERLLARFPGIMLLQDIGED